MNGCPLRPSAPADPARSLWLPADAQQALGRSSSHGSGCRLPLRPDRQVREVRTPGPLQQRGKGTPRLAADTIPWPARCPAHSPGVGEGVRRSRPEKPPGRRVPPRAVAPRSMPRPRPGSRTGPPRRPRAPGPTTVGRHRPAAVHARCRRTAGTAATATRGPAPAPSASARAVPSPAPLGRHRSSITTTEPEELGLISSSACPGTIGPQRTRELSPTVHDGGDAEGTRQPTHGACQLRPALLVDTGHRRHLGIPGDVRGLDATELLHHVPGFRVQAACTAARVDVDDIAAWLLSTETAVVRSDCAFGWRAEWTVLTERHPSAVDDDNLKTGGIGGRP